MTGSIYETKHSKWILHPFPVEVISWFWQPEILAICIPIKVTLFQGNVFRLQTLDLMTRSLWDQYLFVRDVMCTDCLQNAFIQLLCQQFSLLFSSLVNSSKYVYVYMHTYTHIHVHTYMYVHVYICATHVYTHVFFYSKYLQDLSYGFYINSAIFFL